MRPGILSTAVVAAVLSAVCLPTQAAPNRIHAVQLTRSGRMTVVEISGERAPNFTTFKQDSPRRVIVDVAECDLGAAPRRIRGDGELVDAVVTTQYGHSPHGISRVIIALAREAEYRITTQGGSLFVHLSPGTGGLLVSAGVPVAPELRRASIGPSALADAESAGAAPPIETGPPGEELGAPSLGAAKSAPGGAVEDGAEPEFAGAAGEEPTPSAVDLAMLPPPMPVVRTGPPSQDLRPVAVGEAKQAPEPVQADQEPRSAVGADDGPAPRSASLNRLPEPEPARSAPARVVAQAEEEVEEVEEVEVVTEDEPPPPPPPPAEEAAPAPSEEAPPPPPPPEEPASEVEDRVEIAGALKDMTFVGFQQTTEASRVFIKTNVPVKFRVHEEGDNLVVLELENTRIPSRNNRRFLDTHFFDSAVTMITPQEIEGVSRNVRIEIELKNRVPYTSGQEENMVYVNFQRAAP